MPFFFSFITVALVVLGESTGVFPPTLTVSVECGIITGGGAGDAGAAKGAFGEDTGATLTGVGLIGVDVVGDCVSSGVGSVAGEEGALAGDTAGLVIICGAAGDGAVVSGGVVDVPITRLYASCNLGSNWAFCLGSIDPSSPIFHPFVKFSFSLKVIKF